MDVGAGHAPQSLLAQHRLEVPPLLQQAVGSEALALQLAAQLVKLLQKGKQQITAPLVKQTIQGEQAATGIRWPGGGFLAQPFSQGLPEAVGTALAQGDGYAFALGEGGNQAWDAKILPRDTPLRQHRRSGKRIGQ